MRKNCHCLQFNMRNAVNGLGGLVACFGGAKVGTLVERNLPTLGFGIAVVVVCIQIKGAWSPR
jgi:hypothetical protein